MAHIIGIGKLHLCDALQNLVRASALQCHYRTMEIYTLPADAPALDLFDENGQLKLLPAAAYDGFSRAAIQLWCHHHARYGLPTVELIAWLQERIAGKKTIEIGSGSGDLAYHLGIPATDNRMQEWAEIAFQYALMGQPTIHYSSAVQNLNAVAAVRLHRPEVVVASCITEWIDPNLPPPPHGGNVYGVKEDQILSTGCTYILIGNQHVHGRKKIMALPHESHAFPFLRSRARFPELDRVWIWNA